MIKIYYFLGSEAIQPEKMPDAALAAERAGFDGILISDHFNPWVDDRGAAGYTFSILGGIAERTEKLELMSGVITPLFRYHPAVAAQAAATIDRMSGGRFYLGVGTGEAINEEPLGFEFPGYSERKRRMTEAVEIMRRLLDGETLTYQGEYYKTKKAKLYSPPTGKIPIYLAAGGPKSALLAATLADGLMLSVKDPKAQTAEMIGPARQLRKEQKSGKLDIIATRWTVYLRHEKEAAEALASWRGMRVPGRNEATDPKRLQQKADEAGPKQVLKSFAVVKNAEDYVKAYKPLITVMGADRVVIQTTAAMEQAELIRWLGRNVLPKLKNI